MTEAEKLEIMSSINWDYDVTPEQMLDVVDGKIKKIGKFSQETILIRCLERISWHRIVELWGIDSLMSIYRPEMLNRIRSKELRSRYDNVFKILRKQPVSVPRWGSEYCRKIQHAFLSDRWNRP